MLSCLSMDPEEGYHEARKLPKQRYGQSYKIATAYVDKVTKGPAIKSEDRKKFIAELCLLTSCRNTLKSIGYSSKIENPDSLRGVIDRLPYDLRKIGETRLTRYQKIKTERLSLKTLLYL